MGKPDEKTGTEKVESERTEISTSVASAPVRQVNQGPVMPIGGAEEKTGDGGDVILQRFVDLAACGATPGALEIGTDGCGIPTFGATIRDFAFAYALVADPEGARWEGTGAQRTAVVRLRGAIAAHPVLIDAEGTPGTDVIALTGGRVIAKLGAEGLLALAVPDRRLGVAIGDAGGSQRGLGPAAVAVLAQLGLADADAVAAIRERHSGTVTNFAGWPVGEIRPAMTLELV